MDDPLYRLPDAYARPVARGWMSLPQAHAGLLASTYRRARLGVLDPDKPEEVYRGLRDRLHERLRSDELATAAAASKGIRRTVEPLIASRKPPNVLLAEAHNVNGDAGFPLTEREVTHVVAMEVWQRKQARPDG